MSETLIPLFSSLVMVSDIQLNETEEKIILDFTDKCNFIKTREEENSSSISEDYYVLDDPQLILIRNKIAMEVNKYIDHLQYEGQFDFSSSWITKTKPGEQSHYHTHSNTIFSGIFYIKTKDDCGSVALTDFTKTKWGIKKKEANVYNSSTWEITPLKNRIIIFPSNVPHKINPNRTKHTRFSLPFNVIPLGNIGAGEQRININAR